MGIESGKNRIKYLLQEILREVMRDSARLNWSEQCSAEIRLQQLQEFFDELYRGKSGQ